jgi:hypothetical protein
MNDLEINNYPLGYASKEASIKSTLLDFLTNPAGGKGAKAGLAQGVNKAIDYTAPLGIAGGVNMYASDPDKAATAAATGILVPWLGTRTRGRYRDAVSAGNKGMGIPTEMLSKMTPELVAKMGLAGGAAGFDYVRQRGPELAEKLESGVNSFEEIGNNVQGITADARDVTSTAKGDLGKGLQSLGRGTGALGKDIGQSGAKLNTALGSLSGTLDEGGKALGSVSKAIGSSGGVLGNIGGLAEAARKKIEGGGEGESGLDLSDPIGTKAILGHLKNNWSKYFVGASGLAGVIGYALWKREQERKDTRKEEARNKEREIRALNRLARAQEDQ